jgi:hypothetical protein
VKGFFCPDTTLNLTASLVSAGTSSSIDVSFIVADASALFSGSRIAAAQGLAAPFDSVNPDDSQLSSSQTFDWGLPFYYGRTVATAIVGKNTSAGMGPYFAF